MSNESLEASQSDDEEEVTVSLISGKVTRNPKSSGASTIDSLGTVWFLYSYLRIEF